MRKINLLLKSTLLFIMCLFVISGTLNAETNDDAPGIKFRQLTLEKGKAASKAEKKPLYVHGFTEWCHYCMYMKDSVYTDKEVADFFNANFICIKVDMEKEGIKLRDSLKIHNYPAMIFYDTNGEIMHRAAGRKYKQPFLDLGKEALDPSRQLRTFTKKYESGEASPVEVQNYFRMLEMGGMDAQSMINDYLLKQTDSDFTNFNSWRIFRDIFKDPTFPIMKRFLDFKKPFEAKYTVDSVDNKIIGLYNAHLMKYVQQLDSAGYEKEKQKIRADKRNNISEKVCAYADLNKFKMKSDWESYRKYGKIFIEKYASEDARRLTEISQVYYERFYMDTATLLQAEKWVIKSISIFDQYKSNQLLGSISVVLGKKEQALKATNHAIELGKKENIDYSMATQLLPAIEKLP